MEVPYHIQFMVFIAFIFSLLSLIASIMTMISEKKAIDIALKRDFDYLEQRLIILLGKLGLIRTHNDKLS